LYCHCRMLKLATPYSYQHKIHLTHNTTDSMCFMQTLLIIQR